MTTLGTAWANRATTPVPMLHIGDSVTERTGAGGFENGYVTKLLRALQTNAGIAGGPGFVNTGSYVPTDNSLSSFYSPVGSVGTSGFLGNRSGSFSNSQAITVSFTGTSISLHYFKGFGAAQPYTVKIDGGTATTITVPTTGGQNNQGVWTSPTLTAGAHTVLITPTAGQPVYLRGIHVYNGDEGKGIHGWEGGHYGDQSSAAAGSPAAYFADACAVIQPAVCTLFLGLNDYSSGVAAATYQANLASIIASVNSYCTVAPSWVICGIYNRTDVTSPAVPLSSYTAAAQAVANADTTNRRFVDLNTAGVSLSADGVHPNATGHAAIATAIQPAVLSLAAFTATGWGSTVIEQWNGASWVTPTIEQWNGSTWVTPTIEVFH